MRNNAIFWAIILIGVGVLLLLGNLGIAVVSGGAIWGLVLLALGAWLVWGALAAPRGRLEAQAASIPMADATDAVIRISHGAGRLTLAGGAPSGQLVAGSFGGGLDTKTDRVGSYPIRQDAGPQSRLVSCTCRGAGSAVSIGMSG